MTEEETTFIGEPWGLPRPWKAVYSGIEYPGEVVSATEWRPEWGRPLGDDRFFRVVFLATPVPDSELALEDPRVAVCVPRHPLNPERSEGARGLRGIREARARYLTRPGFESARMRSSLEQQEQALRRRAAEEAAQQFAGGRVVVAGGGCDEPPTIAPSGRPQEWVGDVARALLAKAYPGPVVAGEALPSPLTDEVVARLFDGLFNPRPGPEGWAAVRSHGFPVGLVPPAFEGCPLVAAVERALADAGDSAGAAALFSHLAEERGIPRPLSMLGVLAFLARNRPSVEVTLLPDHRLLTREGKPFPGDRITWDLLGEVALHPVAAPSFGTLRLGQPPTTRTIAPYAKEVTPDLEMWEEQDCEQPQRFMAALRLLHEEVVRCRAALAGMGRELAQTIPPEVDEDLGLLEAAAGADDPAAFHHACVGAFGSPARLRQALQRARAALPLAEDAGEAVSLKRYLMAMPPEGLAGEMAATREAMLAQFDLESLVSGPSTWLSLKAQANRLRDRYGAQYREHHLQYHRQAEGLREDLARARRQMEALERLSSLRALGPAGVPGLAARIADAGRDVRSCPLEPEHLPMGEHPVCPECGVTLGELPPGFEVARVTKDVQDALGEQTSRLSALVIERVLERPGTEPVDRFLQVVRAADLEAVPSVLDDRVMEFLRALFDQP